MTQAEFLKRLEQARAADDLLLDQESTALNIVLECSRGNLKNLVQGLLP